MGAQGRQKGSGGSTSLLCNFSTHFIQCRAGFVVLVRGGFTKLESPAIGASAIPRTIDNIGNFMHWKACVNALMTPHRAGSLAMLAIAVAVRTPRRRTCARRRAAGLVEVRSITFTQVLARCLAGQRPRLYTSLSGYQRYRRHRVD